MTNSVIEYKARKISEHYANKNKDVYKYFNRFRVPVTDPFASNVAYVFFTKPDLNFSEDNLNKSTYLTSLDSTVFGQKILSNLTCTSTYSKQTDIKNKNFLSILSNCVLNYETKDTVLRTSDGYENFIGGKMTLPSNFIDSITSDTVTLNFLEYSDLRVTHLITAWVDYINNIKRGIYSPTDENRDNKILDYAASVYFFLCGPDGHSIKFFNKLTGLFPLNIPYSSFNWELGGTPDIKKLSVTFQYQIKEDINCPDILMDFNKVANYSGSINKGDILYDDIKENWAEDVAILDNGLYFYNKGLSYYRQYMN